MHSCFLKASLRISNDVFFKNDAFSRAVEGKTITSILPAVIFYNIIFKYASVRSVCCNLVSEYNAIYSIIGNLIIFLHHVSIHMARADSVTSIVHKGVVANYSMPDTPADKHSEVGIVMATISFYCGSGRSQRR
jgi:hypothetical protein